MRELEFKVTGAVDEARKLHICPDENCGSELVYIADWRQVGTYHYRLWLRCPECEHREEVISNSADQLIGFNNELRLGTRAVRMTLEHMEEDVDAFIGALAVNDTFPEDFLSL